KHLDPSCTYTPSDLVDRGPGTVIVDLNRRPFPDLAYLNADVAVFSGVIEYIRDPASVIEWLTSLVDGCVVSYAYLRSRRAAWRRLVELPRRSYYGYMNAFTQDELQELFVRHGFVVRAKEHWESQVIFSFARGEGEAGNGRAGQR